VTPKQAAPVVVLYGPTASGKSALARTLAERLDGIVVNADSLQVYAELEILTARPGRDALSRAPHRLYGVLPAAAAGSAAWWRAAALAEIRAALAQGKRAIVTGGTGLYLGALIDGLSPAPPADTEARAAATALYEKIGGEAFLEALAARDPAAAARLMPGDRQRLIRAMEVVEASGIPLSQWQAQPRERGHDLNFSLIGLTPPRLALYAAIDARFARMMEQGALDEAAEFDRLNLAPALPVNKALGLPSLRRYLHGEIALDEAVREACQATRNYAKRQMTWFRHQLPETPENDPNRHTHISHARFSEFSERNLPEIISFILQGG
jgi:tRNA dimethylallyltransferase